MDLKRGDIVVGVGSRDYGKPRPAVVVQSGLFNETHASVVLCPITSHLLDAPLFRIPLEPDSDTGIAVESQVMVDKIVAVPIERVAKRIGRVSGSLMERIDEALRLFIGLR